MSNVLIHTALFVILSTQGSNESVDVFIRQNQLNNAFVSRTWVNRRGRSNVERELDT